MKRETKNKWLNIAINVGLVVIPAVTIAAVISLLGFALESGMKAYDPSYERVFTLDMVVDSEEGLVQNRHWELNEVKEEKEQLSNRRLILK